MKRKVSMTHRHIETVITQQFVREVDGEVTSRGSLPVHMLVEADLGAIAQALAGRALKSASGKATAMGGKIVVREASASDQADRAGSQRRR